MALNGTLRARARTGEKTHAGKWKTLRARAGDDGHTADDGEATARGSRGPIPRPGRAGDLVARRGEEDESEGDLNILALDADQLAAERDHTSPPLGHTLCEGAGRGLSAVDTKQ